MNTLSIIIVSIIIVFVATWILSPKKRKPLSEKQIQKTKENQKKWQESRRVELENDKQRVSKAEIRNLILDLKLPQIIPDIFDGICKDEIIKQKLNNQYTAPYAVIELTKKQQDNYLIDRYKPILSYGHATIFAYDTELKGFITYDIEMMTRNPKCLTWDGLFISKILRWWEYELSNEDILHIGNLFGLKNTKYILNSIYTSTNGKGFATFEAADEWKNKMYNEINANV